jgi:hypothetical protein
MKRECLPIVSQRTCTIVTFSYRKNDLTSKRLRMIEVITPARPHREVSIILNGNTIRKKVDKE